MIPEYYLDLREAIIAAGYGKDVDWSENIEPPKTAEDFAGQAIWVILCSGMKAQIARKIESRVWEAIRNGIAVSDVFRHNGKAKAIEFIWRKRNILFADFRSADNKVEFCRSLPWIGSITQWHLAKNLGVDCAKPDVHLQRVATYYGTTPSELCVSLSEATGDRVATVDYVIWRACNLGIIRSRDLRVEDKV